jgi:Fic family protein
LWGKIGQEIGQNRYKRQFNCCTKAIHPIWRSAKMTLETPYRIEPALLEGLPAHLADLVAEATKSASRLGNALHPKTAASLAQMVRIMNTYYSNLIEGNATRPRDIERALLDGTQWADRRDLLIEAVAHVRVQEKIDRDFAQGILPEPASQSFIRFLHDAFYDGATDAMLTIRTGETSIKMVPGHWRNVPEHDVAVGRHLPPSSASVATFMEYFEKRYRMKDMGLASGILCIACAHHRFNYIHPFPDGNGRVSRLMSHAMAHWAGIGAHGLWSISRGLARGLAGKSDYKLRMDHADMPRQGSTDGRGNLSEKALIEFCEWFLRICIDQMDFMQTLFQFETLQQRLKSYVIAHNTLKPETARLLDETLLRGEVPRGEISRVTGLPERSARRVLAEALVDGILISDTPKGAVRLNFPTHTHDALFPKLCSQAK